MKSNGNNYCVILAGGKGRRLWPCSRSNYPKQFVDFFGVGRTQLQQTFDRMAKIVPADHIFINTNEEYVQLVKEQLPEVPAERILAEPIHRNTAPSMAWANHRISMLNPDACIIATPSDQAIFNEDAFRKNVLEGLASDVMMENCHNNVIKLPKGKLAVLNGLDGFIVAENDNVLLICKKEDSSALVRKYVNEVQMKKGDEFV